MIFHKLKILFTFSLQMSHPSPSFMSESMPSTAILFQYLVWSLISLPKLHVSRAGILSLLPGGCSDLQPARPGILSLYVYMVFQLCMRQALLALFRNADEKKVTTIKSCVVIALILWSFSESSVRLRAYGQFSLLHAFWIEYIQLPRAKSDDCTIWLACRAFAALVVASHSDVAACNLQLSTLSLLEGPVWSGLQYPQYLCDIYRTDNNIQHMLATISSLSVSNIIIWCDI